VAACIKLIQLRHSAGWQEKGRERPCNYCSGTQSSHKRPLHSD